MDKKAKGGQLVRIITLPIRALCRARDLYVNSMIRCATGSNGTAIGIRGSAMQGPGMPRSFSTNSFQPDDAEDLRVLIQAAAARDAKGGSAAAARSVSVGMGRIDEERPCCYFGEEINGDLKKELIKYSRSKSHAVATSLF